MKKCINCNSEIDDKTKFCTACGAKQEVVNTKSQEEKYCEMRKGFKGFWWNMLNCGKLNKQDQKKIVKKTVVGCAIFAVLVTCITFLAFDVVEKIENSKRYTYMSTEEFIENWNSAAVENPNGITQGFVIEDDDIDYEIYTLSDTDEIEFHTRGADIISINFESTTFMKNEYDRYGKIEEFLRISFPEYDDAEISGWLEEYKSDEANKAESGVTGFKIEFEEVESFEDFKMSIKTKYSYTNNIIKSDLPWGCAFDCTLEKFKTNHNEKIKSTFASDPMASSWYIYDFSVFGEENYNKGKITQYGFVYYVNGSDIASVYLFVDSQSDKITMIEYQTLYNTESLSDEEFEICYKTLPTCILTSIGFSEYGLYDNYILKAINTAPEMQYYQGVRIVGAGYQSQNMNIFGYRACSEDFFEAEKNGKVSEFIKEFDSEFNQSNTNNVGTTMKTETTTQIATEIVTQTESTSVITETQQQTPNLVKGKTFVNAGDFSPVCDYSLVNSITFSSDKATLQINLMECVVTVETDYTVDGNTVILGEVLTEVGDVMIKQGSQFVFDMNTLTVNGMTDRFVLSGWTCPYQFNDGESFIEVEV